MRQSVVIFFASGERWRMFSDECHTSGSVPVTASGFSAELATNTRSSEENGAICVGEDLDVRGEEGQDEREERPSKQAII